MIRLRAIVKKVQTSADGGYIISFDIAEDCSKEIGDILMSAMNKNLILEVKNEA